jgi:hypothetical protein
VDTASFRGVRGKCSRNLVFSIDHMNAAWGAMPDIRVELIKYVGALKKGKSSKQIRPILASIYPGKIGFPVETEEGEEEPQVCRSRKIGILDPDIHSGVEGGFLVSMLGKARVIQS